MRWRSHSEADSMQLDSGISEEIVKLRLVGEFGHIQAEGTCDSCSNEATHVCCYSGEVFCDYCFHGAREHFIPSRILDGNFQKGLVAPKHLDPLHLLWGTYSVRLPSHLLKLSRSFKRYASAKRSYLVLRQVLRLRPRKNGSSEASSIGSSFDSSTECESEDEFPCRHGDAFEHFDNLPWVRPSENYFTMQEITVAVQSRQLADTLEKACQLVRTDLANCCLRVRRNSIGDRCNDEVKCFACQSEHHLCSRRAEHSGKHLSRSLVDRRRVSWSPSPVSVPLGGIAARRAANAELQRQDRANSWLRRVSAVEASRAGFAAVQLKTLTQFIAEREQRDSVEASGLAKSV